MSKKILALLADPPIGLVMIGAVVCGALLLGPIVVDGIVTDARNNRACIAKTGLPCTVLKAQALKCVEAKP